MSRAHLPQPPRLRSNVTTGRHCRAVLAAMASLVLAGTALAQPGPELTPLTAEKGAVAPGELATAPTTQPTDHESEAGALDALLNLIRSEQMPGPKSEFRPGLEARGIRLNMSLTSIYQQNARGGLDTHNAHRITGSFDTELTLDTARMGLWEGGQIYMFAESGWNDTIDDRVGSLLGVNGDAIGDRAIRVRELWYQQLLLDEKIRFKVGKLDLAVDIDTNAYANWEVTQFLNNALINTSNLPLPDFGLGTVLSVIPTDWLYVTFAAADAQADGDETGFNTTFHDEDHFFSAVELGLTPVWEVAGTRLPGAYRFIGWYDPQPKAVFFDDRDGRRPARFKRDDCGFAFNMDQMVYKEHPHEEDTQGLGVFARYGYAPENVNEIEHFWSLGAQYQGLLPERDEDVLGFGFAQGIISDRLHALEKTRNRESVYELYYNIAIRRWLHITPDIQYVMDPGGDKSSRDAVVVGLRLVLAF